jgi:RHS repeat-associated protein
MKTLTNPLQTPAVSAAYKYDSEGHRYEKTVNGVKTSYAVNPHGIGGMSEVCQEYRADGTRSDYVWGGPGVGLLYEVVVSAAGVETGVRYYHGDQVGSTLALTDDNGAVTGRVEYDAYGQVRGRDGATETPFLFCGAYGCQTDAESGLVLMRARYYHPWLGRFINEDPIQFEGGMNWYGYCGGDPLMRVDPEGTFFHILIGAGIGGIVGVGGQFISDVIRGETSGFNQYAGAFVGGAVTGGLATATGGASLVVSTGARVAMVAGSGAVGAASGNLVEQGMGDRPFSGTELVTKTAIGAATALIPAPVVRVPGLNAGRGSWSHVANTQMTKLANGTTSSISATTLGKIVGANVYRESTSMGYDGVAEAGYSTWLEPMIRSAPALTNSSFNYSGGTRK